MMQWKVVLGIAASTLLISCNNEHRPSPPVVLDDAIPAAEYPAYYNARSIAVPDTLTFAGEAVPLHIADVKERLDRELHINSYWHNNTIFLIKRANRWLPQIDSILHEHGIPADFKYVPVIEGRLLNEISPASAVGFWQFKKEAGEEFGLEINREVDERYDPLKSTVAACKYLRKAHDKFGNWTMVAAAYNRGRSGMQRAINNQQEESYYDLLLNEETSRYVFRILAIKEIIESPSDYGFDIDSAHLYHSEKVKYVEVNESIKDLIQFAKDQGINYKLLKRHNPWLRKEKLTVRKKTYQIAIPVAE